LCQRIRHSARRAALDAAGGDDTDVDGMTNTSTVATDAIEQSAIFRDRRRRRTVDPAIEFKRHRDTGTPFIEMARPGILPDWLSLGAKVVERRIIAADPIEP
jgi:hypothetical protein